ncbi:MAG: PrsW family glutamic-type intramembrane protease [Verrucomicrobiota bacterium]
MQNFLRRLPSLSYRTSFLWKISLFIVGVGIVVGQLFHWIGIAGNLADAYGTTIEWQSDTATGDFSEDPFTTYLDEIAAESSGIKFDSSWDARINDSRFSEEEKTIARLLVVSLQQGSTPSAELERIAESSAPPKFSNYALGLYWLTRGLGYDAAAAFERESKLHDSQAAIDRTIGIYSLKQDFDELVRLMDQPGFEELANNSYLHMRKALLQSDWLGLVYWILVNQYATAHWPMVLIAMITGIAWFAFLIHAVDLWKARNQLLICALAVLLGAMSTTGTLFAVVIQEDLWGFTEKPDLIGGLIYCVAGIGLREELIKLLFFIPLLPFLLKQKNHVFALIVAGCVGLGFAAEENISYFGSSAALAGPGRFLTANFLHISATALCGYSLYRAISTRWKELDYFLSTFLMVVLAHGLYDAFIIVPALMEYSIISMIIYILLCYQMFNVFESIRPHTHKKISLSFVFSVALSVVLATSLGWAMSIFGMEGFRSIGADLAGLGIIVIMFFRVINEPLIEN